MAQSKPIAQYNDGKLTVVIPCDIRTAQRSKSGKVLSVGLYRVSTGIAVQIAGKRYELRARTYVEWIPTDEAPEVFEIELT